jgi:hypothetical protein
MGDSRPSEGAVGTLSHSRHYHLADHRSFLPAAQGGPRAYVLTIRASRERLVRKQAEAAREWRTRAAREGIDLPGATPVTEFDVAV